MYGNVKFKMLGPDCQVEVRPALPDTQEPRVIVISKRASKPSVGLIVETAEDLPVGTMVELTLKFGDNPFSYRPRGLISWIQDGPDAHKPFRLGVVIMQMEKLDQFGIPIPVQPSVRTPLPPMIFDELGARDVQPSGPFSSQLPTDAAQAETRQSSGVPLDVLATDSWADVQPSFAMGDGADPQTNAALSETALHTPDVADREIESLKEIFDIICACLLNRPGVAQQWVDQVYFTETAGISPEAKGVMLRPASHSHLAFKVPPDQVARISIYGTNGLTSEQTEGEQAMPDPLETAKLLAEFGGREVRLLQELKKGPVHEEIAAVGEFVTYTGELVTACAFDLPMAEYMCAALNASPASMVPDPPQKTTDNSAGPVPRQDSLVSTTPLRDSLVLGEDPAAGLAATQYADQLGPSQLPFPDAKAYAGTNAPAAPAEEPVPPAQPAVPVDDGQDKMLVAFDKMQGLFSAQSGEEAATFALEVVQQLISCEAGQCVLSTAEEQDYGVASMFGPLAPAEREKRYQLDQGILGAVVNSGMVIRLVDPLADDRWDEAVDDKEGITVRNLLGVSLHHQQRTIGAILLLNSRRPEGFTEEEADVISYISMSLAEFIDTALP